MACVDMKPNELADHSIIVEGDTWGEQEQHVYKAVAEAVQSDTLDAIVCMAGGWAGGSPGSKDFVKNADAMWRQSVWPAAISAGLATKHLREGGICVLPGAAPALLPASEAAAFSPVAPALPSSFPPDLSLWSSCCLLIRARHGPG